MSRRAWVITGVAIIFVALGLGGPLLAIATDHSKPEQQTPPIDLASSSADRFLSSYVNPTGQVRIDAGQETQAQGQAWALLIAAASGDSARYNSILSWTTANVPTSSQDKEVALDVAWSLAAASQRLGNPALMGEANSLAQNVANAPSSNPAGGTDNGVFFLGASQLQSGLARVALRSFVDNQRQSIHVEMGYDNMTFKSLPVNPSTGQYNGDAMNVPLNLATSCDDGDKVAATFIWTKLRDSRPSRTASSLAASGKVIDSTQSVRAAVASAAASKAAGEGLQTDELLVLADTIQQNHPSMQGAAWDALGRIMVSTTWLGSCAGSD